MTAALSVVTGVDRARAALVQARSDFERLRVRDQARALAEAAAILERKDIQTEASVLVMEAERAIAKANPAPTPQEAGGRRTEGVPREDTLAPSTLRNIRAAHSRLSDEEFEEKIGTARANQEPITRKSLTRRPPRDPDRRAADPPPDPQPEPAGSPPKGASEATEGVSTAPEGPSSPAEAVPPPHPLRDAARAFREVWVKNGPAAFIGAFESEADFKAWRADVIAGFDRSFELLPDEAVRQTGMVPIGVSGEKREEVAAGPAAPRSVAGAPRRDARVPPASDMPDIPAFLDRRGGR